MPKTKKESKDNAVKRRIAKVNIPVPDDKKLNFPEHLEIEEAADDDIYRLNSYQAEDMLGVPHGLNKRLY